MKKFFQTIGSKLKSFFSWVNKKFFWRFKGLNTLVMMQLKDKLNVSFRADKKGTLQKLVIKAIIFVGVTAAIVAVMKVLDMLSAFGIYYGMPVKVFDILFIAMLTLSTITCISGLTKSLYFSRDNLTLLSYPVRANTVFFSKIVVYYIISLLREITFTLPLLLAYGIAYAFPIGYFFWVILMYFILCAVPVAIASIVSVPWMIIQMFFRKHPLVQDIFFVLLLIGITVLIFLFFNTIPEDAHFMTLWHKVYLPGMINFGDKVQHILYPFFFISSVIIGSNIESVSPRGLGVINGTVGLHFAMLFGGIILLTVLAYLTAKPLFFKMAAKPFEFNKKVIFHNFTVSKQKVRSVYHEFAFMPVIKEEECDNKKKRKINKVELRIKLEKALNLLNRDEEIFQKGMINEKRISKLLKRYSGFEYEVVSTEEFVESGSVGFIIENRNGIESLVLVRNSMSSYLDCYDPNYLPRENHPKSAFVSLMIKDILVDIRTPGTLVKTYLMIMIAPIAIAFMNKIFGAINTSFMGDLYVVMFNVAMMVMIPLVMNVEMASVFSREGESAYLLKASPSNYIKTLTAKLVLRFVLMTMSLVVSAFILDSYCTVNFLKPGLIFFTVLLLYTGHLIWSAELDFMNPQDRLYKEVGEGNIANPNETLSGSLVFIITAVFTFLTWFLLDDSVSTAFYKLFLIAAIFFVARVVLAVLKVRGYKTSRGERGRD